MSVQLFCTIHLNCRTSLAGDRNTSEIDGGERRTGARPLGKVGRVDRHCERRDCVHSVRAIEREKGRGKKASRASSGGGGFGVRLRGGMGIAHRLPDTKFLFAIILEMLLSHV